MSTDNSEYAWTVQQGAGTDTHSQVKSQVLALEFRNYCHRRLRRAQVAMRPVPSSRSDAGSGTAATAVNVRLSMSAPPGSATELNLILPMVPNALKSICCTPVPVFEICPIWVFAVLN